MTRLHEAILALVPKDKMKRPLYQAGGYDIGFNDCKLAAARLASSEHDPSPPGSALSDAVIDEIWEAQAAQYGQVCDSEDFRIFARTIARHVMRQPRHG